jgi:hypothetical protein
MRRDELKSELMSRYWQRLETSTAVPDTFEVENAKGYAYKKRMEAELDAFIMAAEALKTLDSWTPNTDVVEVVIRSEHRTHQADIVRSAFLIIEAFATSDLGLDARNVTAISLCKDVMAGFRDRISFTRI